MNTRTTITAALLVAATSGFASAQAIVSFGGGGGPFSAFYGDSTVGDAIGFRFDVNSDIVLTDIGILDDPIDGVLDSAHEVGLWDAAGVLLTSGVVNPGDTLISGFVYTDVADVLLTAGNTYTIAAVYRIDDGDGYLSGPSSITLAPEIGNTVGVFPDASNLGLTFPGSDSPGNLGRIGPNFLFVPAPSTAAMLGLGGIACARRRRI